MWRRACAYVGTRAHGCSDAEKVSEPRSLLSRGPCRLRLLGRGLPCTVGRDVVFLVLHDEHRKSYST